MGELRLELSLAPVESNLLQVITDIMRDNILENINRYTIAQALQRFQQGGIIVDSRERYVQLKEDVFQLEGLTDECQGAINLLFTQIDAKYMSLYIEGHDRVEKMKDVCKKHLTEKHKADNDAFEKLQTPGIRSQRDLLNKDKAELAMKKSTFEDQKIAREKKIKLLTHKYSGRSLPKLEQDALDLEWIDLELMGEALAKWDKLLKASFDALSQPKNILQLQHTIEKNRLNLVDNPMRQQALEKWELREEDLLGKFDSPISPQRESGDGANGNLYNNDDRGNDAQNRPLILKQGNGVSGTHDVDSGKIIDLRTTTPPIDLTPRPGVQLGLGNEQVVVSPMPGVLDEKLKVSIKNAQGNLNIVAQGLDPDGFKNLLENISYSREGRTGRHNIAGHSFFIPPPSISPDQAPLRFQDMKNTNGFDMNNIKDHYLYNQYTLQNSGMDIMSNEKLFILLGIVAKAMKIEIPPNGIDITFLRTNTEAVKSIIKGFRILTGCRDNVVLGVNADGEFEYLSFENPFGINKSRETLPELTLLLAA